MFFIISVLISMRVLTRGRTDDRSPVLSGQLRDMTPGAQRILLRSVAQFPSSRKQQTATRPAANDGEHFTQRWNRQILMWWQSTAGTILDRWLQRIVAWTGEYPW